MTDFKICRRCKHGFWEESTTIMVIDGRRATICCDCELLYTICAKCDNYTRFARYLYKDGIPPIVKNLWFAILCKPCTIKKFGRWDKLNIDNEGINK